MFNWRLGQRETEARPRASENAQSSQRAARGRPSTLMSVARARLSAARTPLGAPFCQPIRVSGLS